LLLVWSNGKADIQPKIPRLRIGIAKLWLIAIADVKKWKIDNENLTAEMKKACHY
jgi:hypothetical protein